MAYVANVLYIIAGLCNMTNKPAPLEDWPAFPCEEPDALELEEWIRKTDINLALCEYGSLVKGGVPPSLLGNLKPVNTAARGLVEQLTPEAIPKDEAARQAHNAKVHKANALEVIRKDTYNTGMRTSKNALAAVLEHVMRHTARHRLEELKAAHLMVDSTNPERNYHDGVGMYRDLKALTGVRDGPQAKLTEEVHEKRGRRCATPSSRMERHPRSSRPSARRSASTSSRASRSDSS